MPDVSTEAILREASKIESTEKFREKIIDICGAHACHVRVSSMGEGGGEREAKFEISTKIKKEEVKRYFTNLAGRLKGKRDATEDRREVYTPSNLWREIKKDKGNTEEDVEVDPAKKVHGLVVGCKEELEMGDTFYITVEWENRQREELDESAYRQGKKVETLTFKKSDFKTAKTDYENTVNESSLSFPSGTPQQWREWIKDTSEYHLSGEYPVSFISIPVALRPTPYGEPKQYLSVEIIWFGEPVPSIDIKKLHKVALLSTYVGARIFVNPEKETARECAIRLKGKLKESDAHNHPIWLDEFKEFLRKEEPSLLNEGINDEILKSKSFHTGLINVPKKEEGDFDINVLFTIAMIHLLRREISIKEVDVDPDVKLKHQNINIDYRKWYKFLHRFDQGKADHDGYISGVTLTSNSLTLTIGSNVEESGKNSMAEGLARSIMTAMLSHDRDKYQTSRNFYGAFLQGTSFRVDESDSSEPPPITFESKDIVLGKKEPNSGDIKIFFDVDSEKVKISKVKINAYNTTANSE